MDYQTEEGLVTQDEDTGISARQNKKGKSDLHLSLRSFNGFKSLSHRKVLLQRH